MIRICAKNLSLLHSVRTHYNTCALLLEKVAYISPPIPPLPQDTVTDHHSFRLNGSLLENNSLVPASYQLLWVQAIASSSITRQIFGLVGVRYEYYTLVLVC